MNKQENNQRPLRGLRNIGLLTMIPMVMVAGLIVGYIFGNLLDHYFKTEPWGKVILSILGVVAGIKQTIELIKDVSKENNERP